MTKNTQQFHHIHTTPSEHHHPALIRAYAKCQAQPDDTCQSDRIAQHRHIGERLHGDQQLVQTLVNGSQSDG